MSCRNSTSRRPFPRFVLVLLVPVMPYSCSPTGTIQSQQLQMAPISSPTIQPGSTETQELRVLTPVGVSACACFVLTPMLTASVIQAAIRLKLRIAYSVAGRVVQEETVFSGFPPGLTGGSS